MSDVTQILNAIEDGDPSAADELLPMIYDELRKLGRCQNGSGIARSHVASDGIGA